VTNKETLKEALASVAFDDSELADLTKQSHALLYWEDGQLSGFTHEQIISRRDAPLNRTRWQFGERREHYCSVQKEDEACSSL